MRKKVTVVGAGNVGASCAARIAQLELADVVVIDILEGVPTGKALDMLQSTPVLGVDVALAGVNDFAATAGSDAHWAGEVGLAWTSIDTPSTNLDDLAAAFKAKRVVPCAGEALSFLPIPGYTLRRAVAGGAKKIASGLSSALPSFKRWLSARAAR